MVGLILFLVSFLLVALSSYLLCCCIGHKKSGNNLLFYVLILVSQIIATVEILSLFKQVNIYGILELNFTVFIFSFAIWKAKNKPVINFSNIIAVRDKIISALNKDKFLLILSLFFLFSSFASLFLTLLAPTNSCDSMSYHLARIGFWVQNQSLAHFKSSMLSQIIFPINSEILILWPMIFLKSDFLAQMPQYLAFLGILSVLYIYLDYLKFSTGRILWTIFIAASLPAVILESMSAQTNLLVGFFLFVSLYLFIYGVRESDRKSVIFSAVSFAVSLGMKYSAFSFVPIFGLIFTLIAVKENKKLFYKDILLFCLALVPAFLILSSYNYILNFIDFGNIMGPASYFDMYKITPGFKPFIANFIRYTLTFIDFTGIKIASVLIPVSIFIKNLLFFLLGLKGTYGLAYLDYMGLNTQIHENFSMYGILGFLLILPLAIKLSLTKVNFKFNRAFYTGIAGLIILGFMAIISLFMGYTLWNNRYLITAVILSLPVLVYSYKHELNAAKISIALVIIFNFLIIPCFNTSKPLFSIMNLIKQSGISKTRSEARLRVETDFSKRIEPYSLIKYLNNTVPDKSKIALIFSDDEYYYPFFEENSTWKLYPLRYETLSTKDYNNYDFLVISGEKQWMSVFDDRKITYGYSRKSGKIIFNNKKLMSLNMDSNGRIIFSGQPTFICNMIDFSTIPSTYKLISVINKGEKSKYYIYRKNKIRNIKRDPRLKKQGSAY